MHPGIPTEQCQAARREMVKQIEQGVSVQQARLHSAVPMHRATAYRLRVSGAARRGERLCRWAAWSPGEDAWSHSDISYR